MRTIKELDNIKEKYPEIHSYISEILNDDRIYKLWEEKKGFYVMDYKLLTDKPASYEFGRVKARGLKFIDIKNLKDTLDKMYSEEKSIYVVKMSILDPIYHFSFDDDTAGERQYFKLAIVPDLNDFYNSERDNDLYESIWCNCYNTPEEKNRYSKTGSFKHERYYDIIVFESITGRSLFDLNTRQKLRLEENIFVCFISLPFIFFMLFGLLCMLGVIK